MTDLPFLPPASGRPARQLVVFLHGYGADGNDLLPLAEELAPLLPDAAFASPHAPEPCGINPYGRQWFGLETWTPAALFAGTRAAAPKLDAILDDLLARFGLRDDRLALVGFSQGTMMALHCGLRRAKAPAAILGFSGLLAGPDHLAEEIRARPPVLLVHGGLDGVVPAFAMAQAEAALKACAVPVKAVLRPMLAHGIDAEGVAAGRRFLADCLSDATESLA